MGACSYCNSIGEEGKPLVHWKELREKTKRRATNVGARFPICRACWGSILSRKFSGASPRSTLSLRRACQDLQTRLHNTPEKSCWTDAVNLIDCVRGLEGLVQGEERSLKELVEIVTGRAQVIEESKQRLEKARLMIENISGVAYKEARRVASGNIRNIELRQSVFARDGNRCLHCGTSDNLSVDHIVPVFRGGSSDIENLQTLCVPCNSSKGSKVPHFH